MPYQDGSWRISAATIRIVPQDLPNRTATIQLEDGETVTCTFTNTKLGTVVIKEETEAPSSTGFTFQQNLDSDGDFILVNGLSKTFSDVDPGRYTVTQTIPSG